jgi:hypothetical protein
MPSARHVADVCYNVRICCNLLAGMAYAAISVAVTSRADCFLSFGPLISKNYFV